VGWVGVVVWVAVKGVVKGAGWEGVVETEEVVGAGDLVGVAGWVVAAVAAAAVAGLVGAVGLAGVAVAGVGVGTGAAVAAAVVVKAMSHLHQPQRVQQYACLLLGVLWMSNVSAKGRSTTQGVALR
jgi:hypothetical protein